MENKIIYDEKTFCLGTTGRYYYATIKQKNVALHRYIYEKFNGPIPEGYHIHHVDGDCYNNQPENLVAIAAKIHNKIHTPSKERIKKWSDAGKEAAKIWHKSEEGKEWHIEQYKKVKEKIQRKVVRPCTRCGKEVETKRVNANCFCSGNCKTRFRIESGLDIISKNCIVCGTEFMGQKYNGKIYCSDNCKPKTGPKPKK